MPSRVGRSFARSFFYGRTAVRRRSGVPAPSRHRLVVLASVVLVLLAGCAASTSDVGEAAVADPIREGVISTGLWSREGLEAQPRMAALQRSVPVDLGFAPGTTAWRPIEVALPRELTDTTRTGEVSPGRLLHRLVEGLGWTASLGVEVWELTYRVHLDDDTSAVGVALSWGYQDDSVTGRDLRATMRRSQRGWHVTRVEERYHCGRSVTPDGLCA